MMRYRFVRNYLFIFDKRMDFWPAMQASHAVVKNDYFGFTMFLLLMALVGLLGVLMVSTLRFSSFKTVGTRSRSMRTIILAVAVGMLIFLYSRYVLLALVIGYILHGLLSRVFGMFRRRSELSETGMPVNQP